jgi:hypothetical protein
MHPDAARVLLSLFEIPIAIGLGFAAFSGVYGLGCSFSHCVDLGGLPWLVAGAVAGLGVAVCYWLAMLRSGTALRRRLIWDGVALVIGIASYAVPITLSHRAEARSVQAAKEAADLRAHQRVAWIESLKANAHGATGEVPPMLSVEDDGAIVAVTNHSDTWKTVALAKVLPNPAASDGWYGCAMYSETDQRYYRYSIGPRQTVRYRLDPACAVAFSGAAIEYRVGDGPGEDGWWSDSAFATPDGRNRGGALPSRPPVPARGPKIGGAPP